jgi:isoamyl acetate esterase
MSISSDVKGVSGLFGSRSVIVLFGDSLTQRGYEKDGWVSALSNHYGRRADIFNRGYGGYNTRWGKWIMYSLFKKPYCWDIFSLSRGNKDKYLTAVVWFGANDAADPSQSPHVPLVEYGDNLQEIIDHLKKFFMHIVIMTPPPVHGPTRLRFQKQQYGDNASGKLERSTETAGKYAGIAERVASANEVLFLDVWRLMLSEGEDRWPGFVGAGKDGGDGLHLSPEGQQYVADHLIALLEKATIPAEQMPAELPWGRDIDGKNFQLSINTYQFDTESLKTGQGRNLIVTSVPSYASGAIGYSLFSFGTVTLAFVIVGIFRYFSHKSAAAAKLHN